jgi:hypothetical protein
VRDKVIAMSCAPPLSSAEQLSLPVPLSLISHALPSVPPVSLPLDTRAVAVPDDEPVSVSLPPPPPLPNPLAPPPVVLAQPPPPQPPPPASAPSELPPPVRKKRQPAQRVQPRRQPQRPRDESVTDEQQHQPPPPPQLQLEHQPSSDLSSTSSTSSTGSTTSASASATTTTTSSSSSGSSVIPTLPFVEEDDILLLSSPFGSPTRRRRALHAPSQPTLDVPSTDWLALLGSFPSDLPTPKGMYVEEPSSAAFDHSDDQLTPELANGAALGPNHDTSDFGSLYRGSSAFGGSNKRKHDLLK